MYWFIFNLVSHLYTTLSALEMCINRKVKNHCNSMRYTIFSKNISFY